MTHRFKRHRPYKRIIATLSALLFSAGLIGLSTGGAQAIYSQVVSTGTQTATTGTVSIDIGSAGTSANRLALAVGNLGPGGSSQRAVNLQNTGNQAWSALVMHSNVTASTGLDTNTTDGLKVSVDECSQSWTESGTTPNFTYTCGGTSTPRLTNIPIVGNNTVNGAPLTPGNFGYYRLTISLPSSAPSNLQGLTSSFNIGFSGTQRAGAAK